MTCIVGVKHKGEVYIGGDSNGSCVSQHTKIHRKDKKVFIRHGIAYGFTSSYKMGQILQYHMPEIISEKLIKRDVFEFVVTELVPKYRNILKLKGYSKINNNVEVGGTFLIGLKGRLFSIEDDFQVAESLDNYTAIGSGDQLALSSMETIQRLMPKMKPECKIERAIKTAAKFNITVGGNIHIVKV